ncbi:MAG: hypothetical protein NVV82_22075 [Sporocytophaga sp.]|nr:hypothetical protein [Sporocytophaga sp.]
MKEVKQGRLLQSKPGIREKSHKELQIKNQSLKMRRGKGVVETVNE